MASHPGRSVGTAARRVRNLSHLPEPLTDMIRRSLQGECFVPAEEAFEIGCALLPCLLACDVEWHLREAWRERMFALSAKATRGPAAQRATAAMDKTRRRKLDDGTSVQRFSIPMAEPSARVRNTCRASGTAADAPPFGILTIPTPARHPALDLIEHIRMQSATKTPNPRQILANQG